MKALLFVTALALLSEMAAAAPTLLSHGRFKDLAVYRPPAAVSSFVLFLSGDEGWSRRAEGFAEQLAQQGAMVVGIDLPKFNAALEADGAQCVFPDGDLENLSHFVQAYFHNSSYLAPLMVGIDSGGSMAYAVLAQAPQDTFAGALSVGFCPNLKLDKPLCKGSGLELTHGARGTGLNVLPIKSLNNPWVVLQDSNKLQCPAATTRDFVARVHGAAIAMLPSLSERPFNAAFAKLAAANLDRVVAPPAALGDLPVIEVPAQPNTTPSDTFAIIMSGDGGWAGIDQNIAAGLSAKGIFVVGWDSLRYYWTARTPEGLAADTDKLIRYYLSHLGKKHVLLIGYSQGADVLPFAVNRLPAPTKAAVSLMAILGMSEHALFEFHVSSWISDDNSGPETLPEVNRVSGMPVLCIYGEDEQDSLCPKLDSGKFKIVKVKGGHHFDGNYAALADDILSAAKP
ncbi:MAG TPA: AcvB/VirJ family lysyl-phosphatidylglycerol hydrolase [Steroidobacteraceae bacterium]|nr:AcvB/VirJ family lysyl-phosphatidylglycerol hydrolase [Steroidobacteraceae bacterium]